MSTYVTLFFFADLPR